MKKRVLSLILAFVFCLGLLPGAALAEPVRADVPAGDPNGDVSLADAGGGDTTPWESPIIGLTVSGAVWGNERTMVVAWDEDAMGDSKDMSKMFGALISSPGSLADPPTFYFPEEPGSFNPTCRVSLFSREPLDAGQIVTGQGVTPYTSFDEVEIGAGNGVLYLYQGLVTFRMRQASFYYGEGQQNLLATFWTTALPAGETDQPYVGEVFVSAVDGDDLILDLSGVNLPVGPAGADQFAIRDSEGDGDPLYTCTGWEEARSDPEHGVYAFRMHPTGNPIQGNSWFPLYLRDEQACFFGNGKEPVTIPALGPITPDSADAGYAVSVQGVNTTGDTGRIDISNMGYTQMRYRVNDGEYSDWIAIPASLTIPTPTVGTYTVELHFRDGSKETTRTTTIIRKSTAVLAAPVGIGIADNNTKKTVTPNADGVYNLLGGHSYLLFADLDGLDEAEKPERSIDVNGKYTLIWNGETKRYEGVLGANTFNSATALTFRASQETTDAGAHGATTLSISVKSAPVVYYGSYPRATLIYDNGQYAVMPGTAVRCYFVGDSGDGITGWAELEYAVDDDLAHNVTMPPVQMENNNGTYTGALTAPSKNTGATRLVAVRYYLQTADQQSAPLLYSMTAHHMVKVMTFSGFTDEAVDNNGASLGDYSGVTIQITRQEPDGKVEYYHRCGTVDGAGRLDLNAINLDDGAAYTYIISGAAGVICTGNLTAASVNADGEYTPASLGLPRLYALTIHHAGDISRYTVSPRLVIGKDTDDCREVGMNWDGQIRQLPAGAQGNLMAYVYLDNAVALVVKDDNDNVLENGLVTVNSDMDVSISLTQFTGDTVTATLLKPGGTKPASGQQVNLTQSVTLPAGSGGILNVRHFSGWDWAYSSYGIDGPSDPEGRFTIRRPAANQSAILTISGGVYKPKTIQVATDGTLSEVIGDGATRPITDNEIILEYRDGLVVTPRVLVRPWNSPGSADYSDYAEADSSQLNFQGIAKSLPGESGFNSDNGLNYTTEIAGDGRQLLFIGEYHKEAFNPNVRLQAGDTIRFLYNEMPSNSDLALVPGINDIPACTTAVLDSGLNASVTVYAVHKGRLRATVVRSNEDIDITGTLLIYRSWNSINGYSELIAQASGRGELEITGLPDLDPNGTNDENERYYAVALRYESKYASQIQNMIATDTLRDAWKSGGDAAKNMVKVQRIQVNVGYSTDIGVLTPDLAGPALLGDYVVQYETAQISGDGTVEVSAWVEPVVDQPGPITGVYVYRTNAGTGTAETVTVNGEKITTVADGGYWLYENILGESLNKYSYNIYPVTDRPTSLRIRYLVRPNEDRTTAGSILRIHYGDGKSYMIPTRTSTKLFTLSSPARQMVPSTLDAQGRPDSATVNSWSIPIMLTASPETASGGTDPQKITVYDNGTAVGTYRVSNLSTSIDVKLTNPGVYGLHELYATRDDVSNPGQILTTEKLTVNVADPDLELNTNHLIWWHHNDRGWQQWRYEKLSDLNARTVRYWPAKKSAFAFVIANAIPEQLDNVRLATSYKNNKEYASYPAKAVTQAQFISLWNQNALDGEKISAADFPTSKNGKSLTYSYWVVDQGTAEGGSSTVTDANAGKFDVDSQGFVLDRNFTGFTVKYNYKGPATDLSLAALMPKSASTWENMSQSAFQTMLGIVDHSEKALTQNSLRAYYAVGDPQGQLSSFGTKADVLTKAESRDADLVRDLQDFLRSEVDDLPAVLRDSINDAIEGDADTVTYDDAPSVKADVQKTLGAGETVLDAYTVTVAGQDGVAGDTVITNSISTVNIPEVNAKVEALAAASTDRTDPKDYAAYVAPDSEEAVRWLMNYERDRKYGASYKNDDGTTTTIAQDPAYANVSWTHYETSQGTVYERYEVMETDNGSGGVDITVKTDTYLPNQAVADMMGKDNASDLYTGSTATPSSLGMQATLAAAGDPFSSEKVKEGMQRFETLGTYTGYLGQADNIRHTYQTSQIIKNNKYVSKAHAAEIADGQRLVGDTVGMGLNIIGATVTVYQISQGPQGKNEDVLLNNLHKIKDDDERNELQRDILDYSDRKGYLYLGESVNGAVNAGASFSGNKVLQGATFLATLYAGHKGEVAHADLDAEFDALVSRINNAFTIQGLKDTRATQQAIQETTAALEARLRSEGFEGSRLAEEMNKFNIVRAASGEFGYVPIEGWRANDWPPGYCPEQPDPNKFEVDWGPSFGGQVPTAEQLAAFYGTDDFTDELALVEILTDKVEAKQSDDNSKSLSEMIADVENDLKTDPSRPIDVDFTSVFELEDEVGAFNLYIDPAGYVFEGVEADRVSGVEATIYQGDGDTVDTAQVFTPWVDPDTEEPQANPQYTAAMDENNPDAGGRYGWMTPVGVWKVGFHGISATSANGNVDTTQYLDAETRPMEVPPEHTAVNIGLLSKSAPAVAVFAEKDSNAGYSAAPAADQVEAYADRMQLSFTKWMQLESMVDVTHAADENGAYDSEYSAVTVTDALGNVIPGVISFPDKTANTGYKPNYLRDVCNADGEVTGQETVTNDYQTDYIGSDWFVKTLVFTPKSAFTAGQPYTLTLDKSVQSYAGVVMSETADFAATVSPTAYTAPHTVTFVYGNGAPNTSVKTNTDGTVTLPAEPSWDGHTFLGWYTAPTGGSKITAATVFTQDTTLYAQWEKDETPPPPPVPPKPSTPVSSPSVPDTANSGDTVSAATLRQLADSGKTLTVTGDNKAAVVFSNDALQALKNAGGDVIVKLEDVSKTHAGDEVYALTVTVGGKPITNFGGDVTVTLPHSPAEAETNPKRIAVFVLGKEDARETRLNSAFDAKTKTVTFPTGAPGVFQIAYVPFPFPDVAKDAWYYDAVDWGQWTGIINGKPGGVFDPQGEATRAELVVTLWRCAGEPAPKSKTNPFDDVAPDGWYTDAVLWAVEQGITQGTGGGHFSPAMVVTREQSVTMLYRMVGSETTGRSPFTDVKDTDYFYAAVLWASENGVSNGTGDGLFSPKWKCDRSQVITMLYRWFAET